VLVAGIGFSGYSGHYGAYCVGFLEVVNRLDCGECITASGPAEWSLRERKHWAASGRLIPRRNTPIAECVEQAFQFIRETWERLEPWITNRDGVCRAILHTSERIWNR
jgi:hypothetical protein